MGRELLYKKGILIRVDSWENDGDYERAKEIQVETLEEALAIKRLCSTLFKSEHSGDLAIANVYGPSISNYEEEIVAFMSSDEYYKNFDKESMVSYVEDLAEDLMGYSYNYNCRVCEKCTIYEVNEDVYINKINL